MAELISPASPNSESEARPPRRNFFKNRPAWARTPKAQLVDTARDHGDIEGSEGSQMFSRGAETLARVQEINRARREREAEAETRKLQRSATKKRKILQSIALDDAGSEFEPGDAVTERCHSASPSQSDCIVERAEGSFPEGASTSKLLQAKALEPTRSHEAPLLTKSPDVNKFISVSDSDSDGVLDAVEKRLRERQHEKERLEHLRKEKEKYGHLNKPATPDLAVSHFGDPIISLLIHSPIEGTTPLLIKRRLKQPLGVVKKAYCDKQGFDNAMAETLVLIWRNRRTFTATTCKSLGIEADFDGEVYFKNDRGASRPENGQIEMEVVTLEELRKRESDADQARRAKLHPPQDTVDDPGEESQVIDITPQKIRIVLKARGYADYKLKVKPTTPFEQIMSVYQRQRQVPEDKRILLVFEGDKLDAALTIADTDIDDMDCIDVHIKEN